MDRGVSDNEIEDLSAAEGTASAKSSRGFVLSKGDVEILRLVLEHRFLRREHISALTGRSAKRLHDRLFQMGNRGYLKTTKFRPEKYIYSLARLGVRALVERGLIPADRLEDRLRAHELTEFWFRHEMMISDIHVILSLASREGKIRLADWRVGKALYHTVDVPTEQGREQKPFRPDGLFTLDDGRLPNGPNYAHFFLEADRSKENHTDFREKIFAYWQFVDQGLHGTKFGISSFRVLTVTLTELRARSLSALALSLLPQRFRKYFLFVSMEKLSIDNPLAIFGEICYSPRDDDPAAFRRPLLPPLKLQQE